MYIVGDGPEREPLEELIAASSVHEHVHCLGFCQDAAKLIAQADALLISSDSEGVPTVLLEAMSAATPVAATAVGGIPEVLELIPSYPARLAPAGDIEAFSEAMAGVLGMKPGAEQRQQQRFVLRPLAVSQRRAAKRRAGATLPRGTAPCAMGPGRFPMRVHDAALGGNIAAALVVLARVLLLICIAISIMAWGK